jgi:hypothetical protein
MRNHLHHVGQQWAGSQPSDFGGEAEMSISLRRGTPADAAILGGICYTAFKAIAEARVAETAGRITGYTTCVAFFGHAVGESNDDLKALIGAAEKLSGSWISGSHPQRRSDALVPCRRPAHHADDDLDDDWLLQRAQRVVVPSVTF